MRALARRYHASFTSGYIYNDLRLLDRRLSSRVGLARLFRVTTRVLETPEREPPFVLFNDAKAGWRGYSRRRKAAPIEAQSADDVRRLLTSRMFFRDRHRYADNYYVTDQTLGWFVVFCHENDWHLIAPRTLHRRVSFS